MRLVSLVPLILLGVVRAQGLPPLPVPRENPMTAEKAVLGKILFWDEQLSSDDTVACGTCHRPRAGGADPRVGRHPGYDGVLFTADDTFASPGISYLDQVREYAPQGVFGFESQVTSRAASSAFVSQYWPSQFWDGRAYRQFVDPETHLVSIEHHGSLEWQAVKPIMDPAEMGHAGRTWSEVVQKLTNAVPLALATNLPPDVQAALTRDPTYPALFQRAFGSPTVTAEHIAFAIATYERTLVPDQTPYDLWIAGQSNAMTPNQIAGFQAFQTQRCDACHVPPHFTDFTFRALGLRPWYEDPGRMDVTADRADRGKFKVPNLRNIGQRSTFMHNGALSGWTQLFDFYDHLIPTFPGNQDPLYSATSVPPSVRPALQDFLENALTDPRFANELPPYDRPTLRSELPGNQGYGYGTSGGGGYTPRLIARQPAFVGAVDFRIGLRDAAGAAPAMLLLSNAQRLYPGLGVVVNVDLGAAIGLNAVSAGSGAGEGYATWQLPLPADPNLSGVTLYVQAFVIDPAAPIGLSSSAGVQVPVL